ncbi:unnamed protein product [Gadus morhua 'NCC']
MICPDREGPATQVVLEVLYRRHHGEEFSASDALSPSLAPPEPVLYPCPRRWGVRTGASVSAFWREVKACWHCGVQVKSLSFCSSWCRGAAVQEKPCTNFL